MENEKYNKTKYNNNFNKNNYDSLRIVTPKGNKDILKEYCKDKGISLNSLVNTLLTERLAAEGYTLITRAEKAE